MFNYWFLQFDFPDSNGKPYKTSSGNMLYNKTLDKNIPVGWSSVTIGEITNCLDSKRIPLSSKEREEIQGEYPYYGATEIMDYLNNYIFDGDYILLAEDGSIMDDYGHPILQRVSGKCWINNHAHVLQPKNGYSCAMLYMLLKDIPVVMVKTGSVQYKVNQANLNNYSVINIPTDIRQKFIRIANPIDMKILKLQEENSQLIKLRDWLLPMLMNGQATIVD